MKHWILLVIISLGSLLQEPSKDSPQFAWIPQAIMLGSSLLGGILGNRKQQQTQDQNSSFQNNSRFANYTNNFGNSSNRTEYDPQLLALRGNLISRATQLNDPNYNLQDPTAWARGVVQGNVGGINQQAMLKQRVLRNEMMRKGLSSSPAAAYAMAQGEGDRISNLINNQNLLPVLQRQGALENKNIELSQQGLANQIFSMIPKDTYSENWQGGSNWGDQEQTGTSQSHTVGTMPGNMAGGGLNSLASMLAYLFGEGGLGNTKPGASTPGKVNPYYRIPNVSLGRSE